MTFAPEYKRNEEGLIEFPEDRRLRQDIFLQKVEHPAKNNLYMLDEIVKYLTVEGDMVLDPMAGAGSTMYTARLGRHVFLIELSRAFIDLLHINRNGFSNSDNITIIEGDCLDVLPWADSTDLIMFSPPYSNQIKVASGMAVYDADKRGIAKGIADFADDNPKNLGNMSEFWFNRAMLTVYERCFATLKPGGFMAVIIKDQSRKGKRIEYGTHHMRLAMRAGLETYEWHRHTHIGKLFGNYNKKMGIMQIEDEHILITRKPIKE